MPETGIEGITISTKDSSLWLANVDFTRGNRSANIIHTDRLGNDLNNGFSLDLKEMYGIAYDPTDHTLWMIETLKRRLWHYTTVGEIIGEAIDLLPAGCNNGRGLIYDPRDNSLWIVNAGPNRMIHINKSGKEIQGSFYFDQSMGLPDGAALDLKSGEYWVADWSGNGPPSK